MRMITVFYAWQSDTPEKFNRHLIRIALEEAAKRITQDLTLEAEVRIDSDTEGVPGMPPVTDTILNKISACDIFVPDVSFVARTDAGKLIPNPNVMAEFGYALRAKTHAAMVPVMNTVFGPPEKLPFDMGHFRYPIQYCVEPTVTDAERREIRRALSTRIEKVLRGQILATQPPPLAPVPFAQMESKDGPARFRSVGEPIGKRWDTVPFSRFADIDVSLAAGPTIWLRIMPGTDPCKKWATHELRQHAIYTGRINLAPFSDTNITLLRAHDGMGICSLITPDAPETTSVAFAFETGEVWSIDTTLLQYSRGILPFLEPQYAERLQDYARFLTALGLRPPYSWIGGVTGVKDRRLQIPTAPGHMRIPGWPTPQCLSDTITEEGTYDGKQSPTSALCPFFKAIFDKCGVPRPDHLPS